MPQETFLKPTWKCQEHLIKRKCLQFVGSAAAAGPPHPHLLLPQALSILFPLGLGLLTPRYPLQLLAFQVLLLDCWRNKMLLVSRGALTPTGGVLLTCGWQVVKAVGAVVPVLGVPRTLFLWVLWP